MAKAVVLLSGGLDSATTLAVANSRGYECHVLSVDYGQRHDRNSQRQLNWRSPLVLASIRLLKSIWPSFGGSALTDETKPVPVHGIKTGVPVTYVPARNTIMLSLALAWAEVIESHDIFVGVNSVDYSGYPDCRPEYIAAFEKMANLATKAAIEGARLRVHAPLIALSKAEIVRLGMALRRGLQFDGFLLSGG